MGPCGWEPLCSGYARQAAARRLQACCDWMFEILHHTVLIPGEDVDTSYITCMGVSWRVLVCIMQAGLASATQRCGWACLSSCVAVTACHPKPTLHPTPESELTVSHCVAGSDSPHSVRPVTPVPLTPWPAAPHSFDATDVNTTCSCVPPAGRLSVNVM